MKDSLSILTLILSVLFYPVKFIKRLKYNPSKDRLNLSKTKTHLLLLLIDLYQPIFVFLQRMKADNNMETLRETVDAVVNSRFPEMSKEGRIQLEEVLIRREISKGEIALNEGQTCREIVFVGKGILRQFYYKNGKDVTEHFSYEGCTIICIESFLKQEPTRLMVEALEPSVVYMFPYDMVQKLIEQSREINAFYRKVLEYSLIVSQIKADSWRFETARERYNLLMEHHPEVIKRAALSHIASYLLMTPETLSRVRSGVL